MSVTLTTAIPAKNGEKFLLQTLESVARQTRRPDRVVMIDNGSTDGTEQIARDFKAFPIEFFRNPRDLDTFGNFNRCLDFAPETEYLHILHTDDLIQPKFYEVMMGHLADCKGLGMAWCLDERIDENNKRLSISGKPDGSVELFDRDTFLARKAEIGNQAFCATLLKTNRQPTPVRFPEHMLILGDMIFWPSFGAHCEKVVHVHELLGQYRWHGSNETCFRAPKLQAIVGDEWETMQKVESLRGKKPGWIRQSKLKGLLAVRSGIKAVRVGQLGDPTYSKQIQKAARDISGLPIWLAAQFLVQLRELLVFKIGGRPRHPRNIFS